MIRQESVMGTKRITKYKRRRLLLTNSVIIIGNIMSNNSKKIELNICVLGAFAKWS